MMLRNLSVYIKVQVDYMKHDDNCELCDVMTWCMFYNEYDKLTTLL